MGKLFNTIQELVAAEKYVVGEHASERLEERGMMEWQAGVWRAAVNVMALDLAVARGVLNCQRQVAMAVQHFPWF